MASITCSIGLDAFLIPTVWITRMLFRPCESLHYCSSRAVSVLPSSTSELLPSSTYRSRRLHLMSSSQARQLQQTEFDELLRMEAALSNPQNTSTVQPSIPNTTRGPGQLQRPDWRQLLPNLPPLPQRGLGDPNVDWTNTLKDKGTFPLLYVWGCSGD